MILSRNKEHRFTLTTNQNSKALLREEVRSLLEPHGIPYRLVERRRTRSRSSTTREIAAFNMFIPRNRTQSVGNQLSRLVSGSLMAAGFSTVLNAEKPFVHPHELKAPLFDEAGNVRMMYSPTRGVTASKITMLMVNLLGIPIKARSGKRIVVPVLGFNNEAYAAALAGHQVIGGDIMKWVTTGKHRSELYTGKSKLGLSRVFRAMLIESKRLLRRRGVKINRLENVLYNRWDARHLPLRNQSMDGALFDPPHGKYFKEEHPIALARDTLLETSRTLRPGSAVVLRVPKEWEESIREAGRETLKHIGTFPAGKSLVLMKFKRRFRRARQAV